ncbi:PREDICTED: uncharacterized protein LOC105967929 [Erythranthe guttata]|uniref:uncharacterized protein LOC105967929 n=1 Tax=Erythranthe guttata TaxID=4155 RepID=UPI00064D7A6A|nr:PREDICTED: uncharacterized protein LOC105967929 [Erythranthe guttata]|eukprot:XP_012847972.1 PREDICTED: uncharacterized protein LOC105967929 [Erythranthe guttata]
MTGEENKSGVGGSNTTDKKMSGPYTLTSNDNPGNVITQVRLKGENYDEWARAVRTSLRAKKKYGFVDGTIERPTDDSPDIEDWWSVNSMLVSWIFNTIEPTLRSTISYMEDVKDLWEEIKQRFSVSNGPRVQQIRSDLANCKQNGQSIVTYYGRLKSLWDELNNYDPIPVCECAGCKCNVTTKLNKKREEERIHQFLMGLDEGGYETVRSNILSAESLPNLNRVYAMVVQQEQVQIMTSTKEERGNPMSFVVQAGRNSGGERKEKPSTCSICKRKGHDAENCFQRIGYPEWWGERPRTTTGGRGSTNGRGTQQNYGRGRGGAARAHAAQTPSFDGTRNIVTNSDRTGITGLSNEQWSALLNILDSHKDGNTERLTGPHFDDADWSG